MDVPIQLYPNPVEFKCQTPIGFGSDPTHSQEYLQLLVCASCFMLEFWIVLDGFELSGIELVWIGF